MSSEICGLQPVLPASEKNERFLMSRATFYAVPFLVRLENAILPILETQGSNVSYLVWGGFAANVVLNITGRCQKLYSFHDVELLVTSGEQFVHDMPLINKINMALVQCDLPLVVGGLCLSERMCGTEIKQFLRNRSTLRNGDLALNTAVVIANKSRQATFIELPIGIVGGLIAGTYELEMADTTDLVSLSLIAKRISLIVSKTVRYHEVAELSLSHASVKKIEDLIFSYRQGTKTSMSWECREVGWCPEHPGQADTKWLLSRVVCETTKRLAGLHGLSLSGPNAFSTFDVVFTHPLVRFVANLLELGDWLACTDVRIRIGADSFEAFRQYQPPTPDL